MRFYTLAVAATPLLTVGVKLDLRSQENVTLRRDRDLVFMHIPYNFGHTVEKVALFPKSSSRMQVSLFMHEHLGGFGSHNDASVADVQSLHNSLKRVMKPGGNMWGHFHPELQEVSNVTGCSLYYTPQKYWPKDLAQKYFGDRTVFGLLRDPYERLVAMVRGANMYQGLGEDYGTDFDEKYLDACDVNNAIKEMLEKHIASNSTFSSACAYLPQAEYFDGEYGVSLPVDNLYFPQSMNSVFDAHGYPDYHIATKDIFHVQGCPDSWAKDLDSHTKGLIKKMYARDFELLCKYFGRCDQEAVTCIHGVPKMCPRVACRGKEKCQQELFGSYFVQQRPAEIAIVGSEEAKAMAASVQESAAADRELAEEDEYFAHPELFIQP